MKKEILKVSMRYNAMHVPEKDSYSESNELSETTAILVSNLAKLGYGFSEELLHAINKLSMAHKIKIQDALKEITGVTKNWTPLVKGWDVPTGEHVIDHIITYFSNRFNYKKGTKLSCGHLIPKGTFPLERYNGCPYCGTPFDFGQLEYTAAKNDLIVLDLWNEDELKNCYANLLASRTALDATQVDSLKVLVNFFGFDRNIKVEMKETLMIVIDSLVMNGNGNQAQSLFENPNDILRYLWYKQTGFLQIIKPKTILNRTVKNSYYGYSSHVAGVKIAKRKELKLKYSRTECKVVANWLNDLTLSAAKSCEMMHPKRGMWIRFIRALRLSEYSKRKGFEKLANLMDLFYNEKYTVFASQVNHLRSTGKTGGLFNLLKTKPGVFARSLFSNMLWFGSKETLDHFGEVADQLPARLLLTLNMYAKNYFDASKSRVVKPLGGTNKLIGPHQFLKFYGQKDLASMQHEIEVLCLDVMKRRYASTSSNGKSIYIEESLFNMPISIGDRSETIQDLPSALMGSRFQVEGDTVRLFMQWGNGLSAQHLDMDLSAKVAYKDRTEFCSYQKLTITGCKHSGDIQTIPNKIGTAEYIDIDVAMLKMLGAKYVSFTCNAYTSGGLSPNMVVGWMNSKYPMDISHATGVAYNPTHVQHQVRIDKSTSKGLVFGVLDVQKMEMIWLELSFGGQVVQNLDIKNVEVLLDKLNSKLSVGHLLQLKAEAQELEIISDAEKAEEVYDIKWAVNHAAVSELLLV